MLLQKAIRSVLLRRAARIYAKRLGRRLHIDYGAGQYYTAGQIRIAAEKSGLPLQYISIGNSAFMLETDFEKTKSSSGDYHTLRNLFYFYTDISDAPFEPAKENSYVVSG